MSMLKDRQSVRKSAVVIAVTVARNLCRNGFDPHVTLGVFRNFRENPTARRVYLSAAGCESGFELHHEGKSILNPMIGRAVCQSLRASEVAEVVTVEGEFCQSYSVLVPP
jgi:hypothetical protein